MKQLNDTKAERLIRKLYELLTSTSALGCLRRSRRRSQSASGPGTHAVAISTFLAARFTAGIHFAPSVVTRAPVVGDNLCTGQRLISSVVVRTGAALGQSSSSGTLPLFSDNGDVQGGRPTFVAHDRTSHGVNQAVKPCNQALR